MSPTPKLIWDNQPGSGLESHTSRVVGVILMNKLDAGSASSPSSPPAHCSPLYLASPLLSLPPELPLCPDSSWMRDQDTKYKYFGRSLHFHPSSRLCFHAHCFFLQNPPPLSHLPLSSKILLVFPGPAEMASFP